MGDRALIIFTDKNHVSPTVYLHWSGHEVPEMINQLAALMVGREGDAAYAAARFVGIAHERIPGNLSLGIWDTPDDVSDDIRSDRTTLLEDYSHGDAGVIVVDTGDFSWRAHRGYLESLA